MYSLFTDDSIGVNDHIIFDDQLDKYDIPIIFKDDIEIPKFLGEYTNNMIPNWNGGAMHFFLDDYRFNSIWSNPDGMIERIKANNVKTVLSPDFSVYNDYPLAMQLWNTYRNRVIGAYMQYKGLKVIPTVEWSTERSYDFCFLGVEKGSTVAVSNIGTVKSKDSEPRKIWYQGYLKMLEVLEPERVVCYGDMPPSLLNLVETICYPTRWKGIISKQVRKGVAAQKGLFDYFDKSEYIPDEEPVSDNSNLTVKRLFDLPKGVNNNEEEIET